MSDFLIKGTIIGFGYEKWKDDPQTLASWLFSAMQTWVMQNFEANGVFKINHPVEVTKRYGEVRAAVVAFENDIHNLSVCFHQINYIMRDDKLESGLKSLYVSNLVENFIINVRSIYDHLSVFPRIIVDPANLKYRAVCTDSLNTLLKRCEDERSWAVEIFTEPLVKVLEKCRPSLTDIKQIRDAIIHDGKEPIINIKSGMIFFRIPRSISDNTISMLPDLLELNTVDFPLLPYLHHITRTMLTHMDDLGIVLSNEFYYRDKSYIPILTVLGGICMPDFMKFVAGIETFD